MLTVRQHLEAIRDRSTYCRADYMVCPTYENKHDAEAALKILDASSTLDGALQTDVYRVIADDPHRAPERIAR